MPPKLVYYVRGWGRNARPTQDMGMSPQENTMNYGPVHGVERDWDIME